MRSRLYIIVISILFFSPARAQQAAGPAGKRDKYPASFTITRLAMLHSDTARVNAYLKLAETRWKGGKDSIRKKEAFMLATRSVELSGKIQWNEGKARSFAALGYLEAYAREFKKADEYFKKAAEIPVARELKNKILVDWAWLHFQSGQFIRAKEEVSKLLPELLVYPGKETLGQAYSLMGAAAIIRGELKEYLTYSLKALNTFKPGDTTSAHLTALKNAGQAYLLNEDLPDALESYQQTEQLLKKNGRKHESMDRQLGDIYFSMGEYGYAFKMHSKALAETAAKNDTVWNLFILPMAARDAHYLHNDELAIRLYRQVLQKSKDPLEQYIGYVGLADAYLAQKKYSFAINAVKKAQEQAGKKSERQMMSEMSKTPDVLGLLYLDAPDTALINGRLDTADRYHKAIKIFEHNLAEAKRFKGFYQQLVPIYENLASAYERAGNSKQALDAYRQYLKIKDSVEKMHNRSDVMRRQSEFNFVRREDSLKYQQLLAANLIRNQLKLSNQQKNIEAINNQRTQASLIAEQSRRQANEQKLKATQKEQALAGVELQLQRSEIDSRKWQGYYMMAGIGILLLLSVFIGRNYYNQRRSNRLITEANRELDRQRKEVTQQRDKLDHTLKELKAAQQQLIQSEKMASLGELTAGIAHEIQNPLNFVNNFSEVTAELTEELEAELSGGDIEEAKAIVCDIRQNLQKINHHGKRADSIVKGMLEHSRTSPGQKEPADLNKLADEYLRLAYHGFRAKDKSFNAAQVTRFDEKLPKINVIQQDMGRVLLNLFNNAFYAVQEKQRTAGAEYKPAVEVVSLLRDKQAELIVKDNGGGIPDSIKDKIMQPFFTTKPTGQGTGLGLSLSYDIVVKGHGGSIKVNSTKGQGTEFIVTLPLKRI